MPLDEPKVVPCAGKICQRGLCGSQREITDHRLLRLTQMCMLEFRAQGIPVHGSKVPFENAVNNGSKSIMFCRLRTNVPDAV